MNAHRFTIQGRFFIGNFHSFFIKAIPRMIGRQLFNVFCQWTKIPNTKLDSTEIPHTASYQWIMSVNRNTEHRLFPCWRQQPLWKAFSGWDVQINSSETYYIIWWTFLQFSLVVMYGSWIYNYLCNQYLSPLTRVS